MRVHLINVGQGSATLIEFPCAAILVDAGGESNELFNSNDSLKAYLDDFFDRRSDLNHTLQAVYLTHPHKDHTLGVPVLLQSPHVIKNVITDGLEQGSGKAGQIMLHRAAQDADATPGIADDIGLQAVTTAQIGANGLTNEIIDPVNCNGTNPVIKILWGASATNPGWGETAFKNGNNHSLVIRIEYGTSSLLITGDLEEKGLQSLVAKYNTSDLLDADVYLVGHHGSKNGTTQELLDKVTPQIALIGCGSSSRKILWSGWAYGHPNKDVLDKLQLNLTSTRTSVSMQAGTAAKTFVPLNITKAIYTTASDGSVILEADNAAHWHKVVTLLVPTPVNINTATVFELETLPGIGFTKAQAIIDYRTNHGSFTSFETLDDVPGIGPATINLIRPFATVQ